MARMPPTSTMLDIRPAAAADVPALQRVIAAAFGQYRTTLPPTLYDVYLDDLLDVAGRIEVADVLVAIADGEIVGTVTFYADGHGLGMAWPPGWSVFRALAVVPHCRSRGDRLGARGRVHRASRGRRRRGAGSAHRDVHDHRRRPL